MKSKIIVLGAFAVLAAGCGGGGEPDRSIPQAAPSTGSACEEQTDGTAWQPAALSTQDGGAWQPPTEPHAIGEEFTVGDWKIAVTNIQYDGGDVVADLVDVDDQQWVVAVVTLTYDGPEPSGSMSDLESRYVGADGIVYEDVTPCPDAVGELPAGEITTAVSLVAVPPDQVEGGIWGITAGVENPGVDDLVYVR